jgi:protein TonB
MSHRGRAEVYTPRELARAAGVPVWEVEGRIASGEIRTVGGRFISHGEAVRVGRRLRARRAGAPAAVPVPVVEGPEAELAPGWEPPGLFERPPSVPRDAALPAAASTGIHVAAGLLVAALTSAGLDSAATRTTEARVVEPMRLVYLNIPGPGGGGGGGGLRQSVPPPAAKREGRRTLSSPLPPRQPPPRPDPPRTIPPPPKPAEELPPVDAPVATVAADEADRAGVLEKVPENGDSRGRGDGGGVGSGQGTGIGEGQGPGVGPGWGGGTGGGPYRPGSGIDPPVLLREVKPLYTEEARRRGITGEVVLEIVVRADGAVGDVRLLEGLGYGLDQRAIDAVRQWRFSPARRQGRPVDVLVEVAVEFRLR